MLHVATANQNPPPKSNKPTEEEMLDVIKRFATDKALGEDAQIKFDLYLIDCAYRGSLSLDPNKHAGEPAGERSDYHYYAKHYVRVQQGNIVYSLKTDAGRKLLANTKKCITLGSQTKWGPMQPMQMVNDFIAFRQAEKKKGTKGLDDAHNGLMKFITAQNRSETVLSDEVRNSFAFKAAPEAKTVIEVLDGIRKTATKLTKGQAASCTDADDSKEVHSIIESCNARIKAILTKHNAAKKTP